MLELIFQGFAEWMYGLVLEAWEYFASAILDVMSLDFSYLESHIPAITSIRQALLAAGWALLIGNLVFQAIRGMVVGLGFEGEDPKLLFTRSFVFSFLLLASPQICDLCLDMTSMLMQALDVPSAVDVHLVDSSVFGSLSVSWLLIIIFNIIIMFQVFKLLVEVAERYVILGVLTMVAPMAFGVGGSKSTADIYTGWCRMYGSMCVLMVSHVIFLKMLLSVLSAVPSGLDTFLWMILVLSIVKVAKKADSIITRIGLSPARQESRPPVPAQPRFTAPTLRPSPGTAGTAPSPGRTASPVEAVTSPTRPAAPAQPAHPSGYTPTPAQPVRPGGHTPTPVQSARPGGQTPTPAQPIVRQSSPAAKVAPAVKASPAPTNTRYKRGYPAKSSKGGKKRHER